MDLSAHLRAVLRRKWRILLASLLIAGLVYAWRSNVAPTYQANALVNVVPGRSLQGEATNEDDTVFLTESYAALATTTPVAAEAAQRAGLDISARQVLSRIDVEVTNGSYLQISATAATPLEAQELSAAVAAALIDQVTERQQQQTEEQLEPMLAEISDLEDELASLGNNDPRRRALELQYEALVQNVTETRLRPLDRIAQVTPARAAADPIDPRPRRDALLALIVALVVNSELAVALTALGGRFDGDNVAEEITAITGIRVLGEIPQGRDENDPAVVEAFRSLRTSLLFLATDTDISSMAVVGGERGSGKSFVSLNLCRSIAGVDRHVVLIDGDLRNPALHEVFGVRRAPGLVDAMTMPSESVAPVRIPGEDEYLHFLPAGSKVPDPAGILARPRLRQILTRMEPRLAVIDTPPLRLFADGMAIAVNCSVTLLVVDVAATRRKELTRMMTTLRRVGVEPVGIVLNRVVGQRSQDYDAYRDRLRPARRSRQRPAPPSGRSDAPAPNGAGKPSQPALRAQHRD